MRQMSREFLHRHAGVIGGVFMFVALVVAAVTSAALKLPKRFLQPAVAVVGIAFGAFFVSASSRAIAADT